MKTAIIIGVGALKGLGAQLCIRFAEKGLHIIVAGRSQDKLQVVVDQITNAGGSAEVAVADATKESDVIALFAKAQGDIELAIYNAGNNTPGSVMEMTAEYFEKSWRVACFGAFLFGREAAKAMVPNEAGTILFTGASASLRGKAGFGAFTSAKGGLRNFSQALAKEVGPQGVHVAHVVIDGAIDGDRVATRYPEYADMLATGGVELSGIVDAYEFLHQQPSRAWSYELDLRTSIENW